MLRLILASVFLIAVRKIATEKSNSSTNGILSTPSAPIIGAHNEPNGTSCSSLGIRGASCVSITRCTYLVRLYRKPIKTLTPSEKKLLFNSVCAEGLQHPYVCCQNLNITTPIGEDNPPVTNKPSKPIRCGQSINDFTNKVTGGTPAKLGDWPWMAALYFRDSVSGNLVLLCGGSLIADEWVLTAAHCIPGPGKVKLSHVRLGDLDLDDSKNDSATPVDIGIKQVIKHEKYSMSPMFNDIALLRLSRRVNYTDYIRPVCLHTDKKYLTDAYYDPKKGHIAGWGDTQFNGNASTHLLAASVNVMRHSSCTDRYDRFLRTEKVKIDKTVICANGPDLEDSCTGDSGGPLMFRENQSWFQGGIVSQGFECGNEEYPAIYTKVASFANWIRGKTGLKSL